MTTPATTAALPEESGSGAPRRRLRGRAALALGAAVVLLTLRVPAAGGGPLVKSPVTVAGAGSRQAPAVAADDRSASQRSQLVVWQERVSGQEDIYGAVVGANGDGVRVPPFRISLRSQDDVAPDVAWSSQSGAFLVVWEHRFAPGDADVHGAVVDVSGRVLDPEVLVSTPLGNQRAPSVAGTGTDTFLVTWEDDRGGGSDIFANRVEAPSFRQVQVKDGTGFEVSTDTPGTTEADTDPAAAWNGMDFLVAWETAREVAGVRSTAIDHARVNMTGTVQPGATPAALRTSGAVRNPDVAGNPYGSHGFLVVWEDVAAGESPDVAGRLVGADGVAAATQLAIAEVPGSGQLDPAVAFHSGELIHMVAWRDERQAGGTAVYRALVDTGGRIVGPNEGRGDLISGPAAVRGVAVAPGSGGAIAFGVADAEGTAGSTSIVTRSLTK